MLSKFEKFDKVKLSNLNLTSSINNSFERKVCKTQRVTKNGIAIDNGVKLKNK